MFEFTDYSYEELLRTAPLIRRSPFIANDISLGSFLMWHKLHNLKFAVINNTFLSSITIDGQKCFSYPFGDDTDGALDALCEYCKKHEIPLVFYCIEEEMLGCLRNDRRFTVTDISYERCWSDYLYDTDQIESFAGRNFSGQRNHINKYRKLYGEPDIRSITTQDLLSVHKMLEEYYISRDEPSTEIENEEFCRTYELLEHFEELGMYCGGLYAQDKLVGFTIGEIMENAVILHVEKALTKYTGAYPTLFNGFIKYLKNTLSDIPQIVNREDDSGDEGLRTSKMQYRPIRILHKYTVRTESGK